LSFITLAEGLKEPCSYGRGNSSGKNNQNGVPAVKSGVLIFLSNKRGYMP
jgi:hypothetical protein